MTLKHRVSRMAGIWEGTYRHLSAEGATLDVHRSRQETRLIQDRWYERIAYRWHDGRERVLDFRARFDASGERLVFDDPDFHGEAHAVGEDITVFPYHWKRRPDERVVETVVLAGPEDRSRLWQRFLGTKLQGVTLIVESRVSGEPAEWY